jgi:hypothetical protein
MQCHCEKPYTFLTSTRETSCKKSRLLAWIGSHRSFAESSTPSGLVFAEKPTLCAESSTPFAESSTPFAESSTL